LWVSVMYT